MAHQVEHVGGRGIPGEEQLAEDHRQHRSEQLRDVAATGLTQAGEQHGDGEQVDADHAVLGPQLERGESLAGDEGRRQPLRPIKEQPMHQGHAEQNAQQGHEAAALGARSLLGAHRRPGQPGDQQQRQGGQVAGHQPEVDRLFHAAGGHVVGHAQERQHVGKVEDGDADEAAGQQQDVALRVQAVGAPADGEDQHGHGDGGGFQQHVPGQVAGDRRYRRGELGGQQHAGQQDDQHRQGLAE
ncbi:hypothetical protein D3C78_810750 [compost metagenome]